MDYYKIVDIVNGNIRTLFHGVSGSKTIPIKTWVKAEKKIVSDGPNGTKYISGWHVLKTKKECEEYLKKFTNLKYKQILRCKVRGEIRPKKHSSSNVFLADEIYFY